MTDFATEDVGEGIDWYNEQKDGLGERFYDAVWESLMLIQKMPYAFPVRFKNLRATSLNKFPYIIYYLTKEDTLTVVIIAVLHTKRDNTFLEKRL